MTDHVLLIDISNGIDMKLGLAHKGQRPHISMHTKSDSLDEFKAEIAAFLSQHGNPPLGGAAISAGGWEENGIMAMPNHRFNIGRDEMREFLGVQRVNLVNDCVAKALAVPHLANNERIQICGGNALPEQMVALISVHNGLGMAGLAPDGMGGYTAMPCEGGHTDLPASNHAELRVLEWLTHRYGGHVSRERAISLHGIVDIWCAMAENDGELGRVITTEDVIAAAANGEVRALAAVNMSMAWLAAMASDVALTLGARGGVYLTGELLDMVGGLFNIDAFVKRYGDKGRLSQYVSNIPVYRTAAVDMELIGLSTLF